MNIVVVGHVDHGKSTVVGRLLVDTGSLPEGKLEQVKATCLRNSKPFEYAFLLDTLKDEQSQGITIDSTRIFFSSNTRDYTIIDAPGHIEFLKNMITGAARAEAALLLIDAKEGVKENSRRHGYILSMLGVGQVVVIVNKMDLFNYDQTKFEQIRNEFTAFLKEINVNPVCTIPISGFFGENIVERSAKMDWYNGPTVIQALDGFKSSEKTHRQPFRMSIQDIYKFTRGGDDRRIVAGQVDSGMIGVGDEIVFYPCGKKSKIKTIEAFASPTLTEVRPGMPVGFTLVDQIYIKRGEIGARPDQPVPKIVRRFLASVFWLSRAPFVPGKVYILKLGTQKVEVQLESLSRVINTSSLQIQTNAREIGQNEVGDCVLRVEEPIAVDLATDFENTGRFVLVDGYDAVGGGLIRDAYADLQTRERVASPKLRLEKGSIAAQDRAERTNQKPTLILISGLREVDQTVAAKKLETDLFDSGYLVYYLGLGNPKGLIDEAFTKLAEIAHYMLDAGMILIVTGIEFTQEDLEILKTSIPEQDIRAFWMGVSQETDIKPCRFVATSELAAGEILMALQNEKIIFKSH